MLAYLLKRSAFSFFQPVLETGSSWGQTIILTQLDKNSYIEMVRVTLLQQYQPQDLAVPRDAQQRHVSIALSSACPLHFLPHTGLFPPSK